jgi:hypothetical protein
MAPKRLLSGMEQIGIASVLSQNQIKITEQILKLASVVRGEVCSKFKVQIGENMDYYVNKNQQLNGDHEVHNSSCNYLPSAENRTYLGNYNNCRDAVAKAKTYYSQSNGCYWCSNACHTT